MTDGALRNPQQIESPEFKTGAEATTSFAWTQCVSFVPLIIARAK